jgi:hypothetical protein
MRSIEDSVEARRLEADEEIRINPKWRPEGAALRD